MTQINKLFINTTMACNMDCPRCYIPKNLRDNHTSRLDCDYLAKTLQHESISHDDDTIAIYMGGEPSIIGEEKLRAYMTVATTALPNARHTIVTNLFSLPNWLLKMSQNEFCHQIETTYAMGKKQTLNGNEKKYQQSFIQNLRTVTQAGINCTVNVEVNIETIKAGTSPIMEVIQRTGAKDWAFDCSINFDEFNTNPIYDSSGYPILQSNTTLEEYWHFVNNIKRNIKQNKAVSDVRIAPRSDGFNIAESKGFLTINPNNTVTTNPLFSTMKKLQYPTIDALNESGMKEQHQKRAIHRIRPCIGCNEFDDCQGFSAHVPIQQDGICAGGLECQ